MLSALVLTACSDDKFGPDPEKDRLPSSIQPTRKVFLLTIRLLSDAVATLCRSTIRKKAISRCFICRNMTTMVHATIPSGASVLPTVPITSRWARCCL